MKLFEAGFERIMELVNVCVDRIFEGALFWGIIGIIIGLVILFLINFIPTLRPKRKFFKILNIVNILYLPLFFGITLGGFGGIKAAKVYLNSQISETIVPMTKMSFPGFQIYLATDETAMSSKITLEEAIVEFTKIIDFHTDSDYWLDKQKIKFANSEVPIVIGWGIEAVVDAEIAERGFKNVSRIEVANHMSFLKLKYSFWRDVEQRTEAYADRYFKLIYLKLIFLSLGMGSFLLFQIAAVLFRPKNT